MRNQAGGWESQGFPEAVLRVLRGLEEAQAMIVPISSCGEGC
jgi:hypothetical protein